MRTDFKTRDRVGDGSLTLMIGLSRSGKTRWVNNHCYINRHNKIIVISADDVRRAFGVEFDTHLEPMVKLIVYYSAAAQLARGEHVVIDATNLTVHSRRPWFELARHMKVPVKVVEVKTPVDVDAYMYAVKKDNFPWGIICMQVRGAEQFGHSECDGLKISYQTVENSIDNKEASNVPTD